MSDIPTDDLDNFIYLDNNAATTLHWTHESDVMIPYLDEFWRQPLHPFIA